LEATVKPLRVALQIVALTLATSKLVHAGMPGIRLTDMAEGPDPDPWLKFAGMFKGDRWINDWKRSVEEYRQKVDDEQDAFMTWATSTGRTSGASNSQVL
jgi:hypothetical protein